jgi:hypothetical protein
VRPGHAQPFLRAKKHGVDVLGHDTEDKPCRAGGGA